MVCVSFVLFFSSVTHANMISNILSDETVSASGHDFFSIFSDTICMDDSLRFSNLIVKELPDARSGNKLLVEYEYRDIFATMVYSGSRSITQSATRAAMIVRSRIRQMQRQKDVKNPDLAESEF